MTIRKLNRNLEMAELHLQILKYSFLSTYDKNVKLYKKRLRQLEYAKQFKNHKLYIKL